MAGPGGPGVTTLVLPPQWGAQVQPVVGELRSHRLQSGQKKKKKRREKAIPKQKPPGTRTFNDSQWKTRPPWGFPGGSVVTNPPADAGDTDSGNKKEKTLIP